MSVVRPPVKIFHIAICKVHMNCSNGCQSGHLICPLVHPWFFMIAITIITAFVADTIYRALLFVYIYEHFYKVVIRRNLSCYFAKIQ